jgi:aminoglycoside phosphotransferase (APT) family kinase protein
MTLLGTPPAEVHIDAELARALLRAQHPDLAHLPVTALESGWDNAMYGVGDALALRLPRRELGAKLVAHEQRWLPHLAPLLPLRTPVPVRTGVAGCGYPWSWSIVEWLPGEPADLSPPRADQADALAQFLRALHTPAPPEAPRNSSRGVPLALRAAVLEERLERLERTTDAITGGVKGLWREALEAPIDAASTWLHGDLHPRNVLVEAGRLSSVIDWGDVAQGDRATDLATIWMLLRERSARERVLDLMPEVSPATWIRARGWAVFFGVVLLDTGLVNEPRHAALGRRVLTQVEGGP